MCVPEDSRQDSRSYFRLVIRKAPKIERRQCALVGFRWDAAARGSRRNRLAAGLGCSLRLPGQWTDDDIIAVDCALAEGVKRLPRNAPRVTYPTFVTASIATSSVVLFDDRFSSRS